VNLTEPILRHAQLQPDVPALIEGDRTVTYAILADGVLRSISRLTALGVKPGDQIGLCLKDDSTHVTIALAVLRLGAIVVPIDWRARPAEKARVAGAFPFKLVLTAPDSTFDAPCATATVDDTWHKVVPAGGFFDYGPGDWHAPAIVTVSSGTTGVPKFSLATHLQYFLHTAAYLEIVPTTRRQRLFLTLPLFFTAGLLVCLAHLLRGDTLILYPSLFTPPEFVRTFTRAQATVGFVPPTVVRQLLSLADGEPLFPEKPFLICGGAPLFAEEKRDALRKLTSSFHEIYGSAASGPMTVLRPEDITDHAASIGRPFSLVDIEVVDDNGRPLGPEVPGRLRCRGPGVTSPIGSGYGPDDFRDGWYYPGELAARDERGYVFLQGRTSEVIFRGGAKIMPAEVEAVLQAHEAVIEAAVVGRLGSANEQELVAYVIANKTVSSGEILAHCRTQLTAHKVPREIRLVQQLPRTTSGKVDKRALTTSNE